MKKTVVIVMTIILMCLVCGCAKTVSKSEILGKETSNSVMALKTVTKDLKINGMPISSCYKGYIIALSNEGNGQQGVFDNKGNIALPFGSYTIRGVGGPFVEMTLEVDEKNNSYQIITVYNLEIKEYVITQSEPNCISSSYYENNHLYIKNYTTGEEKIYDNKNNPVSEPVSEITDNSDEKLYAEWIKSENDLYYLQNSVFGKVTDVLYNNVRSYSEFFNGKLGVLSYSKEIKSGVSREAIISADGKELTDALYLNISPTDYRYLVCPIDSSTVDIYEIILSE